MYLHEEAELYSRYPSTSQVSVYLCDQITFPGLGSGIKLTHSFGAS